MNFPSSSSSSPPDLSIFPRNSVVGNCQVCGKTGHGNHFGAITCRACAAFFRRFGISNNFKLCNKNNNCAPLKNGYFNCKYCRLQRCWKLGMTIDNFQFQRDSFHRIKATETLQDTLPPSMDTFLGRSNLIIYCAPKQKNSLKTYIDVRFLVDKVSEVLSKGVETPAFASNSLEKLALGLQNVRRSQDARTKITKTIGREEMFEFWENDILSVAKWLTYFDEFQQLPLNLQVDMLKGIWFVWSGFQKLVTKSIGTQNNTCQYNQFDFKNLDIDISWCSKYTFEQLKFFGYPTANRVNAMIQSMIDLQATDVELSYMMCQLCFHHVGKRYQGEILKVTDQLQETLSNNLHDYYVNSMNTPRYSTRIARMMKINNFLQQGIYQRRVRMELMKVFDVFYIEYSDPDMFADF